MFPNLNPRKMQQMMKQLGIQQVDIPATEVVIKGEEKNIIIRNPSVAKVNLMGQETFQISGEVEEEEKKEEKEQEKDSSAEISEEDIKTVMEQAGVNKERAKQVLEETEGDLAEAIVKLKSR
ncbi:MAG: nascent polypeptide-associated complex protein [Nanoarchaeota archaeon]